MILVEYIMCRPGVVTPTRSNPSDAGLDVYYNPAEDEPVEVPLRAGTGHMFKTGIKLAIPHGYAVQAMNRGSMGSRGIVVGAHLIDAGYRGEIFIDLHNINKHDEVTIRKGDKIAQLVMFPVVNFDPIWCIEDDLDYDSFSISKRGNGALGSTNE